MIDLASLKDLFIRYQATEDKILKADMFADMISNMDYLILYFLKKCRRRLPYLQSQEPRELYHTSIIALHNAACTFPPNMSEEYIPCRLRAYMLAEFKKMYRYIDKENGMLDPNDYHTHRSVDAINLDQIDYQTILASLTKDEAELLDDYMSKKKQVQEIAKEQNLSSSRISGKVKGIVKKFETDREDYEAS